MPIMPKGNIRSGMVTDKACVPGLHKAGRPTKGASKAKGTTINVQWLDYWFRVKISVKGQGEL